MQIEPELLFTREEYAERLNAVRVEMHRRGVEVLLIDESEHLFYVAGWHASGSRYHACIVPVDRDPIMILRRLDEPGFLERTCLHDYVV
jgi:Xaa-Pro dipeptidase